MKTFATKILKPNNKVDFISGLRSDAKILDVGCGNNSPYLVKNILPSCQYIGIDVADYHQTKPILADDYVITTPESFADSIRDYEGQCDAVISSHNLEHCNDRDDTLNAMLAALNTGGRLYLSFPSEDTIHFPNRGGTLNYYDDPTHIGKPPNFLQTLTRIEKAGCTVTFKAKKYRPMLMWIVGALNESTSKKRDQVMSGTWDYYGFESIIIARKT